MKKLTLDNLDDLFVGSAILGSGGGCDPTYGYMAARYEMEKHGPVSLISVAELKPDQLIIPIGFMGSVWIEMEKLPSGREFIQMIEVIEQTLRKKVDAVMPFEIGGENAFIPIIAASQMGLPVVDADTMGRAFPEAQMSTCNLFKVPPSPGFLTDSSNNAAVVYATSAPMLEKISRQVTVAMGSNNAFGMYPMKTDEVEKCTLHKSISKAISIGKVHREAKKKGNDPLEAILSASKGICIGSGKIVDIDRAVVKAFLSGTVTIQNRQDKIEIVFQNEYLIAKLNDKIVATTPDILILLEQDTGAPITSDLLQFGLKVNLVAMPAPQVWTSPEGLVLVGPRHFGYEVDYRPITRSKSSDYKVKVLA